MSSNHVKDGDLNAESAFSIPYGEQPRHSVHVDPKVSPAQRAAALCASLLEWHSRLDRPLVVVMGALVVSRVVIAPFGGEMATVYHTVKTLTEAWHWPVAANFLLKVAHRILIWYAYRGQIEL